MNKKKGLKNKGFSLVELIIVIAIMAILTGVLVPNFLRYLERAREASDIQMLDNVRSVFAATLMDPQLLGTASYKNGFNRLRSAIGLQLTGADAFNTWQFYSLAGGPNQYATDPPFTRAILEQLGYSDMNIHSVTYGGEFEKEIRSNNGNGDSIITIRASEQGRVSVEMSNSTAGTLRVE